MKYTTITLACFIGIAGCSPLPAAVFNKPGVSKAQFTEDSSKCEAGAQASNPAPGPTTGANTQGTYEECMTRLGYTKQGETPNKNKKNPTAGILVPSVVSQ